jgi:hypothetical protein
MLGWTADRRSLRDISKYRLATTEVMICVIFLSKNRWDFTYAKVSISDLFD